MATPQTDSTAARVRVELARRQMPHLALCDVLGLSRTGVSRRLNGHTDWTVGQVLDVARFLGVTAHALIPETADAA